MTTPDLLPYRSDNRNYDRSPDGSPPLGVPASDNPQRQTLPAATLEVYARRTLGAVILVTLALSSGCGSVAVPTFAPPTAAASSPTTSVPPFVPFYVGPIHPGNDVMHYTEYSDNPDTARRLCVTALRQDPGVADCLASPDTGSWTDLGPGWARQYGPSWAPTGAQQVPR